MSEWWTYRPSDFIMFSARSLARLVEGYHADFWPLPLAAFCGALLLLWCALSRPLGSTRWIALALAAGWAWIGWAFHLERFATINSGATWSGWAFLAQAGLLAALGGRGAAAGLPAPALRHAGLAIAAAAV